MAAARDVEPVYYERYMIDYNNRPPRSSRPPATGSIGSTRWITPGGGPTRRTPPPTPSTNSWPSNWPNWAKLFFNNKGVAAHTTDICANHPPNDVRWTW